jgi:putative aldouronate transport system substrate-binding protein
MWKQWLKKKGLLSVAAVITLTGILSACGTEQAGTNTSPSNQAASEQPTNSDKTEEKKLRIMAGVVGGKTPEEMVLFEKEIERLSGIQAHIEKPASDYDKVLMAAMSAGEKYDLLHVSKSTMNLLIEQGILSPLTEFVNSSEMLSDNAVIPTDEWEQVRAEDGQIYGVFMKFQGGTMPIVRQDWLDKLDLETPKTLDDFYNVLKAFKERDPDGNGKDDTYGLSTAGLYEIQGFMSAAGVKQRYVMEDGKRVIPYATDAAIPVYEFFAKLYKEGIMDPNFVTNDTGMMRNMFLTDRVGMVTYWDAWVGMFNNMKQQEDPNTAFVAKGIPGAEGPNGDVMLRRGDPDVWVMPINAEHPETAKEFLEFWHTKEGITLGSIGIQDHDYTVKDGKMELTEIGEEHSGDHGVPFCYNTNVEPPFGKLPGVQDAQDLIKQYGSLELTLPGWTEAEKIVNNYSFKAMTGDMSAADAVAGMQKELKAANLID